MTLLPFHCLGQAALYDTSPQKMQGRCCVPWHARKCICIAFLLWGGVCTCFLIVFSVPAGQRLHGPQQRNQHLGTKSSQRVHVITEYMGESGAPPPNCSPPEVDRIWLWVYCNKIPICPIFCLLKGDYIYK